jgi:hypothetical protein
MTGLPKQLKIFNHYIFYFEYKYTKNPVQCTTILKISQLEGEDSFNKIICVNFLAKCLKSSFESKVSFVYFPSVFTIESPNFSFNPFSIKGHKCVNFLANFLKASLDSIFPSSIYLFKYFTTDSETFSFVSLETEFTVIGGDGDALGGVGMIIVEGTTRDTGGGTGRGTKTGLGGMTGTARTAIGGDRDRSRFCSDSRRRFLGAISLTICINCAGL